MENVTVDWVLILPLALSMILAGFVAQLERQTSVSPLRWASGRPRRDHPLRRDQKGRALE